MLSYTVSIYLSISIHTSIHPCPVSTLIFAMEQFSCVNWTDETMFTIFSSADEQNSIDFSSAGGLRNTFSLLSRAVLV